MSVHKDSVDIAVAVAGRDGEVLHEGTIGGDFVALDKALRSSSARAIACMWQMRPDRAGS